MGLDSLQGDWELLPLRVAAPLTRHRGLAGRQFQHKEAQPSQVHPDVQTGVAMKTLQPPLIKMMMMHVLVIVRVLSSTEGPPLMRSAPVRGVACKSLRTHKISVAILQELGAQLAARKEELKAELGNQKSRSTSARSTAADRPSGDAQNVRSAGRSAPTRGTSNRTSRDEQGGDKVGQRSSSTSTGSRRSRF